MPAAKFHALLSFTKIFVLFTFFHSIWKRICRNACEFLGTYARQQVHLISEWDNNISDDSLFIQSRAHGFFFPSLFFRDKKPNEFPRKTRKFVVINFVKNKEQPYTIQLGCHSKLSLRSSAILIILVQLFIFCLYIFWLFSKKRGGGEMKKKKWINRKCLCVFLFKFYWRKHLALTFEFELSILPNVTWGWKRSSNRSSPDCKLNQIF